MLERNWFKCRTLMQNYMIDAVFARLTLTYFSQHDQFLSKMFSFQAKCSVSKQNVQFQSKIFSFKAKYSVSKQNVQFPSKMISFQAKCSVSQQNVQFPSKMFSFKAKCSVSKQNVQFQSISQFCPSTYNLRYVGMLMFTYRPLVHDNKPVDM